MIDLMHIALTVGGVSLISSAIAIGGYLWLSSYRASKSPRLVFRAVILYDKAHLQFPTQYRSKEQTIQFLEHSLPLDNDKSMLGGVVLTIQYGYYDCTEEGICPLGYIGEQILHNMSLDEVIGVVEALAIKLEIHHATK